MTRSGAIKLVIGLGLVGWLAYALYDAKYAGPRDELRAKILSTRQANDRAEAGLDERFVVRRRLKQLTAPLLGGTPSVVEHELRTSLGLVAKAQGLTDVSINTGKPAVPANPYTKTRRGTNRALSRLLRDQRDFAVIGGSLSARGTLEQVLGLIAALDAQPWVGRIDSLRIQPADDARKQFELRLGLASLYVPDLASDSSGGLPIEPTGEPSMGRWAPIAAKHVFRYDPPPPVKPEPVVVQAAPDPPPPPPPPPPYHEWTVTGVVESPQGVEVWLVNGRTSQRRALTPGAGVLGATLVSASGESAVFAINDERFSVHTGQTLANRGPAD